MQLWDLEDVKALWTVAEIRGEPVAHACGFCGRSFVAGWWLAVSVAHEGRGGATIALCEACTSDNWDELVARTEQAVEVLETVDVLRQQE